MLDVEEWAEIRRLHRAEGVSIKEIARRLGVAANTVRVGVAVRGAAGVRPRADGRRRSTRSSREIRALLAEFPRMPATVIAERIGWDRSLTMLKDRVRELRPLFVPPDPCQRTEYRPGELAQWDLWFPPATIPVGSRPGGEPAGDRGGVGLLAVDRRPDDPVAARRTTSWAAISACLVDLGGVPRSGVYDNEAALVSRHGGRAESDRGVPTVPGDARHGR